MIFGVLFEKGVTLFSLSKYFFPCVPVAIVDGETVLCLMSFRVWGRNTSLNKANISKLILIVRLLNKA